MRYCSGWLASGANLRASSLPQGTNSPRLLANQSRGLRSEAGLAAFGCVGRNVEGWSATLQSPFLRALTRLQPLLEEGDLLAQRVDSVQLLQGVGQPADGVRADVLGLRCHEVVEGGQHQLEFLRGEGELSACPPWPGAVLEGRLVVFKGTPCCKSRCEALQQRGAQLGSLPDPCLCEAGVALKIEQGWRESLAAHSPGLEPAVHGRGPWQGGEGRGRAVHQTPTSSSASTLLFRSFISSFISLEGPEKI